MVFEAYANSRGPCQPVLHILISSFGFCQYNVQYDSMDRKGSDQTMLSPSACHKAMLFHGATHVFQAIFAPFHLCDFQFVSAVAAGKTNGMQRTASDKQTENFI